MSSVGHEIDPQAFVSIHDAIASQGTIVGQHEDMLRNLSSINNTLFNQLSQLTGKVTLLVNWPATPSPAAVAHVTRQLVGASASSITPVREPHVPVPECYSGEFGSCQAFFNSGLSSV